MSKPKLKIVPIDYNRLLTETHRRWIITRDPADGEKFEKLVLQMAAASRHQGGE